MIITEELIRSGVSERGGWNRKQTILLGFGWPLYPGWKSKIIGKEISESDADLFLSLKGQTLRSPVAKGNKLKSNLPLPVDLPTDSARVADSFWVWVNRQPKSIREKIQESLIYMARKNGQAIASLSPVSHSTIAHSGSFSPPTRKVFTRHVSKEYVRPSFDAVGNDEKSETPPWT